MSALPKRTAVGSSRPRRRIWLVLTVLCAIVLLGDFAYWQYVARQIESGFVAWQAEARAGGWTVQAGPTHIGGWPAAATLTVGGVALTGGRADIPGGLGWGAQQLELRVALWHPQELVLRAFGPQHLRLGNAPGLTYISRRMQLALPLTPETAGPPAELQAEDVRMKLPPGVGTGGLLTIGTLHSQFELRADAAPKQPAVAFTLDAGSIALPPDNRWALGPDIASLRLDGVLDGPLSHAPGAAARAAAWRDGGGALHLRDVAVQWGPLQLSGTASLGLDPALQPQGTGAARVTGYDATLDALAAHGVLANSAAFAAKAVLSLLAQAPQGGGPAVVDVPLNLRQGILSMQQVPLLRVPPLDWRGGKW